MNPANKNSIAPLPMKERMKVPRQPMPEQAADERNRNFSEVNLGYSPELAQQEALRCLECAKPTCTVNCPVGVKVKEFVELIVAGDFLGAAAKIREDNVLPAVTGRVCPQEDHCEGKCLLSKKVKPLGIGYLERFVADYEQRTPGRTLPRCRTSVGEGCVSVRGQSLWSAACCDPLGTGSPRYSRRAGRSECLLSQAFSAV